MRRLYRILAHLIALEVVVQAAALAYAFAGLDHWVQHGGVLDSAAMNSDKPPFPELTGFIVHGINGSIVVPALALLLLVFSLFAKVPGGVKWAGAVFGLVAVQALLGYSGHDLPVLGALHGFNALLLFAAALHTGRRARVRATAGAGAEPAPVGTAA